MTEHDHDVDLEVRRRVGALNLTYDQDKRIMEIVDYAVKHHVDLALKNYAEDDRDRLPLLY